MSQEHRYIECPIVRFHVTMFWHWATILRTTCTRVWWTSTLYNQLYIYILYMLILSLYQYPGLRCFWWFMDVGYSAASGYFNMSRLSPC